MVDRTYERLLFAYLLTVIAALVTFAAFPRLDLAVSGLFADAGVGFPWADGAAAVLNLVLRRLGELAAVGLVLWCLWGWVSGSVRGDDLRCWSFAAAGVVLASGVLVNLGLKSHVGRARPDQLAEFGGLAAFSPAWQVTDQCARNCSFTSGEVALAASLASAALVLLWPRMKRAGDRLWALALAGGYVGVVTLLRVGLGRHFVSDAVFSILVSVGVAFALYPLLQVGRARQGFDPGLPVAALRAWVAAGRARLRRRPI